MKTWLIVAAVLAAAIMLLFLVRWVGGLTGSGHRPHRGSLGGGTHQDKGGDGRPRRPRRGGF